MGKRELVALLDLSSWCLVMVDWLLLAVPWGCLWFVIVVFPDHTHLLFLTGLDDTCDCIHLDRWIPTLCVLLILLIFYSVLSNVCPVRVYICSDCQLRVHNNTTRRHFGYN